MNRKIRGIQCELDNENMVNLLDFLAQASFKYYIPWCLIDEDDTLLPEGNFNIEVTFENFLVFSKHLFWELVLHIYPYNGNYNHIETYEDFLSSSCICSLIYYDCGVLELYIKDFDLFQLIWDRLTSLDAKNLTVKTDENDTRMVIHL